MIEEWKNVERKSTEKSSIITDGSETWALTMGLMRKLKAKSLKGLWRGLCSGLLCGIESEMMISAVD
ncbi:hypothetical protein MSG28_003099 [Choristoneura fumiferana]|uniref:Uncharacterized protein n=1 Tax=Choristoneura fumiferana TaxID=7141 RepID=A0ACC0KER0_CHOFU|nr:hypothetical protein MSG28_003099 [Choristoneura fumiferana]